MVTTERKRLPLDVILQRGIRPEKFRHRPREYLLELEACYQCVVTVRGNRELGFRLLALRGQGYAWSACLAALTLAS